MRLLVVEDEERVRSFVRRGFAEAGLAVDAVADGERALEQALSVAYDAVVLDPMLPGRDGLAVLRALRERGCVSPACRCRVRRS